MNQKTYPAFSVLLVDDEPAWLDSLSLSLERIAGITNTILCEDSQQVTDILSERDVGLVLLDLTMPYLTGQELLRLIAEQHPGVVVIIITGMNQLDTAVGCMKHGAYDYFVKTAEEDRLVMGVLHAIRMVELQRENQEMGSRLLDGSLEHPEAFAKMITISKTMLSIFLYVESIAKSTQPILITGESGVGKELIARASHELSGCTGPMVCVNVAGLDDNVFADTLFGHVKGAYTGADTARHGMIEEAAHGTLLLDEIGDLSISSQVKLLRVLQDGAYFPLGSDKPKRRKARVIVATNQDISAKMSTGQFRKDLYYRLQTHRINIPPLRERKEDLPLLVNNFLEEASSDLGKKKPSISKELLHLLETYNFPGNIRELRSMIYDVVSQHKSGVLSMDSFLKAMDRQEFINVPSNRGSIDEENIFAGVSTLPTFNQALTLLVKEAMVRSKGNQSLAARLLGISQSALNKRLKRKHI
ncbi:MAG: sigma-54 dependent transcriptional regulator [Deltaproteobacteria bacterium]|nr:sigma-54 dependent transcriptional regulator [Deltaproteobacteria bacterium]